MLGQQSNVRNSKQTQNFESDERFMYETSSNDVMDFMRDGVNETFLNVRNDKIFAQPEHRGSESSASSNYKSCSSIQADNENDY